MKRNTLKSILLALALMLGTGLYAVNVLDQARIYINPGHGGWGSNDRPMETINYAVKDTLGFFETNTNLLKGLELRDQLEAARAGYVKMSRTVNGITTRDDVQRTSYDKYYEGDVVGGVTQIVTLSVIARDVEENNMDYFISIHSNAATEGTATNYPLLLYRGTDSQSGNGLVNAREMTRAAWEYIANNKITYYSAYTASTANNSRGDLTFYGSSGSALDGFIGYLGVLKHGCDGYLSEGCFHTYQPERHRLLNKDYCRQEGIRYARAVRAWFGDNTETKGSIMGTVKDKYESLEHALYTYKIASVDEFKPLNEVQVILQNESGTQLATYTTDKEYNGIYVFNNLAPGKYKLVYNISGYWPETEEIEVVANETSFINKNLTNLLMPEPGTEEDVTEEVEYYFHPVQDGDIAGASAYNFIKESELPAITALDGLTIRRAILRFGKYYVLAVDAANAPKLLVLDPETGNLIKEMSTTGIVTTGYGGKSYPYVLSDIAFTNDNVLLGFNSTVVGKSGNAFQTGDFYMYKWQATESVALEDAEPEVFLTLATNSDANILLAGFNNSNFMANSGVVSGDLNDFMFYFDSHAGNAWTTTYGKRYVVWRVKNGTIIGYQYNDSGWNESTLGEDVRMTLSPLALDHVILDGNSIKPRQFKIEAAATAISGLVEFNEDIPLESTGATYFRYAGDIYMSTPVCEKQGDDTYSYKSYLYNITNGFGKAVKIGETEAYITGEAALGYMTSTGVVDNADIDQYLLVGAKAVKYTTKGIQQVSGEARIFAYGLTSDYNETSGGYDLAFTLNVDATSVELVLINITTGAEEKVIPFGALAKGVHSKLLSDDDIPESGRFYWNLRATGDNITRFQKISGDESIYKYFAPKGVAIDKSPASDYFGRVYITNTAAGESDGRATTTGVYVVGADGSDVSSQGNTAYAGSISWTGANAESPRKVAVAADGRIFIADASAANAGIYYMNPETFDVSTIFTGATNAGGSLTIGGTYVGGQMVAIGVRGSGDDTQLYAVDKTASGLTWRKLTNVYNIGTNTTWTAAPSSSGYSSSYVGNDNASIVPVSTGYWGGQFRSNGAGNVSGTPYMFYYSDSRKATVFNTAEFKVDGVNFVMDQSSENGGLGVKEDEGLVALSYDGGVYIFEYKLDSNDIPVVRPKYQHALGVAGVTYDDFEFDYAGNLYAVSNKGKLVSVWAMPTSNNSCTTPAQKDLTIVRFGQAIPGVSNLAAAKEFDKVTLSWEAPNAGMTITGYDVYKDGELLTNTAETTFVDEPVDNGSYVYDVVTFFAGGFESPKVSLTVKMDNRIANIYASSLQMTDETSSYDFSFVLNQQAREVFIEITDGENVLASYDLGGLNAGINTYSLDKSRLPIGANMYWQVRAIAPNISEPVKISDETQSQMQFYGPRGLAVDNNPENPNFGRVYISESQGGTVTGRTTQNGIYILDPLFTDITGQGATSYKGGQTWNTTSSPFRINVAPDGRLFISDWSDGHSGVYIMDTENPASDFTAVYGGERATGGLFSYEGVNIGGSTPHCWVLGEGDDAKLYVFDEDYTDSALGVTKGNNILQYNIGGKTLPWTEAPSAVAYNDAANGGIQLNGNTSIAPDGKGGWWVSQYRGTDAASVPSLIHVNASGTVDFNSGNTLSLLGASNTGGMAVSNDFKKLAIGTAMKTLKIFDISFDGSDVPSLTLLHTISTAGNNTAGLAFDVADNVYLVSNSNERLSAWSLPKESNTFTTPAPSSQLIGKEAAAVEGLTAVVDFNKVSLTWTAPQGEEANIESYKVYRDNGWLQDVATTSYVDENLDNGTYTYAVTAVYTGGIEGPEATTQAIVNMQTTETVGNLQASISGKDITLTWEAPQAINAIPTSYNVYCDNTLISNVSERTYTHADRPDGMYVYAVTALYGSYETEKATVPVSLDTSGLDMLKIISAVYPNPTDGLVSIESKDAICKVQVLDIDGRLMMTIDNLSKHKETIDISTLAPGLYMLKINDVSTVRIIRK